MVYGLDDVVERGALIFLGVCWAADNIDANPEYSDYLIAPNGYGMVKGFNEALGHITNSLDDEHPSD